jgi:hypothetical protein
LYWYQGGETAVLVVAETLRQDFYGQESVVEDSGLERDDDLYIPYCS